MPTNFTDDLRLAHVLADDADSTSSSRFKAMDLHVVNKPDLTPVSDADKTVEEGIRRVLSRARPRDAVLGEPHVVGGGPRCAAGAWNEAAERGHGRGRVHSARR